MVADMHFIAELPAGYDGRTRLTLTDDNRVVATHPEQLPLVLQPSGQWVELWTTLVRPAHRSSTC